MSQAPKIFISYSHKDHENTTTKEIIDELLAHLDGLELDVWMDNRQIAPGEDFEIAIDNALQYSSLAVLVISANYLASKFIHKNEQPVILELADTRGVRVFPVLLTDCAVSICPALSKLNIFPSDKLDLLSIKENSAAKLHSKLRELTEKVAKHLRGGQSGASQKHEYINPPDKVFFDSSFPSVHSEKLVGREQELLALDEAWENEETSIVYFEASGGTGKTELTCHWIQEMNDDKYRGAKYVYGYSFYSQGSDENRQVSSDQFFISILQWLGINTNTDSVENARALSQFMSENRVLLFLDGVEPVQYDFLDKGYGGKIKDRALHTLLLNISNSPKYSLCVVSTRIELVDFKQKSVKHKKLDFLTPEAGVQLLKNLDVNSNKLQSVADKHLMDASEEYEGHALSLTLLGSYVIEVLDGDILQRDKIPKLGILKSDTYFGGHASRMLHGYAKHLEETAEIECLFLLGLFDRDCDAEVLEHLINKISLSKLPKLSKIERKQIWNRLYSLKLVSIQIQNGHTKYSAHPLIREYFGNLFKTSYPDDWKNAHSVLYSYFKNSVNGLPNTLAEMEPLFRAIWHGCKADMRQEAFDKIYAGKILRLGEFFIIKKLGAISSNLACLANFFDKPFDVIGDNLSNEYKGFLLNNSSFMLSALGRMQESMPLRQLRLENAKQMKQVDNITAELLNLSDTYWHIGELENSLGSAKEGLLSSEMKIYKENLLCLLASVLTVMGKSDVENIFQKAEKLQKELEYSKPYLYSMGGFQYCIFLIEDERYSEAIKRAEHTVEIAKRNGWLLDIGLDTLTIGRGYHLKWLDKKDNNDKKISEKNLIEAVETLRKASTEAYLTMGLLARAEFLIDCKEFTKAENDLAEVYEIANREMKLHMADYWLCRCKLAIATHTDAKEPWESAKNLIEEIGYGLRYKKLSDLAAQIDIEYTPPPILAIDLSDIEELLR